MKIINRNNDFENCKFEFIFVPETKKDEELIKRLANDPKLKERFEIDLEKGLLEKIKNDRKD